LTSADNEAADASVDAVPVVTVGFAPFVVKEAMALSVEPIELLEKKR
jgi:hypothetical protein